MTARAPVNVLVAGGGVAALEATLALRALAEERVAVELLAPEPHFWYRPLAVAAPFELGDVTHFELSRLAAEAGASYSPGALVRVDAGRRLAYTHVGAEIPYDVLLVACGTVPSPAIAGALTFRGPADVEKVGAVLDELAAGTARSLAFAVPSGAVWSLPAYELALLTAEHAAARGLSGVRLALVTPEEKPLGLFGAECSEAVRRLLEEREIDLHTGVYPAEVVDGELRLIPEGAIAADRVIALPRLRGPRIDGLPQTTDGFLSVDAHGRVHGFDDVFAAGDVTTFPVKQGGIAAQQADSAAHAIAADAGAEAEPLPFRPVLRGLLLTGRRPRYLRSELTGGQSSPSTTSLDPLWWPPAKISGRYLGPFLAALVGGEVPPEPSPGPHVLAVRTELDAEALADVDPRGRALADESEGTPVGEVMTSDPLVVAPEETLDEIAGRMRERDVGCALVAERGRLVGIVTSRDLLLAFAGRVRPSEARAVEWMTAEPVFVHADETVDTAIAIMRDYGFYRLPVVDGERPVGLVGLRQAVSRARREPAVGLGF